MSFPIDAYYAERHKNKLVLVPGKVIRKANYASNDRVMFLNSNTGKTKAVKMWDVLGKENYDRERLINPFGGN